MKKKEKGLVVAIDASIIGKKKAGIEYYTWELIEKIALEEKSAKKVKNEDEKERDKYLLLTHNKELLKDIKLAENFEIVEIKSEKANLKWIISAVNEIRKINPDRFISTGNFLFGFLVSNTIQIIYDLAPITNPEFWPKKARIMFWLTLWLSTKRAKFVSISEHTKNEFNRIFPSTEGKTWYIGTGLTKWAENLVNTNQVEKTSNDSENEKDYLLSVSTIQPRKNYLNMIRGFAKYVERNPESNLEYKVVGKKGWYYDEVFEEVEKLNMQERIKFLGYVDEESLLKLYKSAKGFMYLSFEEGFGMPNLEAYASGTPVLTSDIPVFREVMKENAIYANPNDPNEIANKIQELINRDVTINKDFLTEYTWSKVVERFLRVMKAEA